VPGSPTPGQSDDFTTMGGLAFQPYEPQPAADALANDMANALWSKWNQPYAADPRAADNFDISFAGFPHWKNPTANNGAGGYQINYATSAFMPCGCTEWESIPFSSFSAFVTWWTTAEQAISPKTLVKGTDYAC